MLMKKWRGGGRGGEGGWEEVKAEEVGVQEDLKVVEEVKEDMDDKEIEVEEEQLLEKKVEVQMEVV